MARHSVSRIAPRGPSKASRQPTPSTGKAAPGGSPTSTPSGGKGPAGKANQATPPNSGKPA